MQLPPLTWSDFLAIITIFGGILFFVLKHVFALIDKSVTGKTCAERHGHIDKEFEKGSEKFHDIQEELKDNTKTLTRVETKMDMLLKVNGNGNGNQDSQRNHH